MKRGSGEIDWSNINAETISIHGNSGMTLQSNSGIEFGCNNKLTIDVANCDFNISNLLNVQADRINFGATTMIEFLSSDSGGVGIWGELRNTKTNSLYITENDLANYATTEYVNSAIQNVSGGSGEIDWSNITVQFKMFQVEVVKLIGQILMKKIFQYMRATEYIFKQMEILNFIVMVYLN